MNTQIGSLTVVKRLNELRQAIQSSKSGGATIGLVPTMGALHEGHFSLIEAARAESDFVVVSVFVNPTQFGPQEDFSQYPRPFEKDAEACQARGVDLIFHPEKDLMYPDNFLSFVEVERLSSALEGKCRPGHFRGVTTIVLKLFNSIQPDVAYFGQKDFQQQLIIKKMCRDLNVPVEIRTCSTVREADGLALSSRNIYLSAEERISALSLSQSLALASEKLENGETDLSAIRQSMLNHLNAQPFVTVDYATIADPVTLEELETPRPRMVALVAAHVNQTRLIDNRLIEL